MLDISLFVVEQNLVVLMSGGRGREVKWMMKGMLLGSFHSKSLIHGGIATFSTHAPAPSAQPTDNHFLF